jgi:hypothetical protein
MAKYKNIVGSGFPDYVQEQLQVRQNLVSQSTRNSTALQFLTNRNSFVRLSSGVLVKDNQEGFSNNLAKTNVLQGGLVTVQNPNTATFNKRYTIGETDNLGFKPNPGITNLSVGTGGRWQTLMQADIEFICYDLDQLDIMSKLYMSLGCHVFLEWGHIPYVDNNGTLQTNISTLDFFNDKFKKTNQVVREINKLRKISKGNYDALLGRIYNFDFTTNSDGTYNCKIQVMGPGQMIESIKINSFSNFDYDKSPTIESSKYESSLANALTAIKKYLISSEIAKTEITNGRYFISADPTKDLAKDEILKTNLGVIKDKLFFEPLVSGSSYGDLLNNIYGECVYRGPKFIPQAENVVVNYSNDYIKYGNAHQIVSNIEEGSFDDLSPILSSFYNGYATTQPTQLSNNEEDKSISTYITFGHLLTLVQHVGIPTESPSVTNENTTPNLFPFNNFNPDTFTPLIKIDYHPDNTIINRGPLEASINPNICLIPLSIAEREIDGIKYNNQQAFSQYINPLNTVSPGVSNWLGKITEIGNKNKNLFINSTLNKINNTLGNNSFEGKIFNILINIDFAIDSLKSLSNVIDSSIPLQNYIKILLDGINTSLGQVNNLRVFFDDNSHCIRIIDEIVTEEIDRNKLLIIPNYGTQSTTYDYSFQSKISPNLATQIVISTQAENSGGLQEFSEDVLTYRKLNDDILDKFSSLIKQPQTFKTVPDGDLGLTEKALQPFFDHLYLCYSGASRKIINTSSINSLINVYKELQNTQKKFLKTPYGNVLIPLEYSITIDGISGILPYNAFVVPDNRLPKRYKDKNGKTKVAFAVFSINHNFDNNQWTTTLRGQTLLIDKASLTETNKSAFIGPQPQ